MDFKYRKSMDPLLRWEVPLVYEDTPTFLAVPRAMTPEDLKGADVAIVGTPYQGVAPVARVANTINIPIGLRQYSVKYAGYLPEMDLEIFDELRIVDYGDVPIGMRAEMPQAMEPVVARIGEILDAGCLPIAIGGTCGVPDYACAAAIAARASGDVGTISLDAHGDNLPEHIGGRWGGATWVARMLELEHINPAKHVQLGMRGPRNFRDQVRWFRDAGCRLITMGEVRRQGMKAITEEIKSITHRDTEKVVLTIDYDVMDLSCAAGFDEPYGLYVPELLEFMYDIGKAGVDAMAVGWIPAMEPGQYAIVIFSLLYLLAGIIDRRGRRTV